MVVATSEDRRNQVLIDHVCRLGFACESGSENDVLGRFVKSARSHQADVVVRITGDCPLVDPRLVDEMVRGFKASDVDYFSHINPPTYPDGLDIEVCPAHDDRHVATPCDFRNRGIAATQPGINAEV